MREVTKPGDSRTTTHSLPIFFPTSEATAIDSSDVSSARTISSSFI